MITRTPESKTIDTEPCPECHDTGVISRSDPEEDEECDHHSAPSVTCTQLDGAGVVCECCERRISQIESDFGVTMVPRPPNCPRCGLVWTEQTPQVGEVWLRLDTRKLYVVTLADGAGSRPYATGERLHPRGPQGCDPDWSCALWRDQIRQGKWIKVEAPPTRGDSDG